MDRRRDADTGIVDEVARQRQKRSAARRDQLVGTTESVQDESVEALAHASRGQQRLRTVAQLEALLLRTEAPPTR